MTILSSHASFCFLFIDFIHPVEHGFRYFVSELRLFGNTLMPPLQTTSSPTTNTPTNTRIVNGEGLIDASLQRDIQSWWIPSEFHQLDAGKYDGFCTAVSNNGVHVVHEYQNRTVRKFGITPENICVLSMARITNQSWAFSQFRKIEGSWLFFKPEHTEFDVRMPGDVELTYICLPQDRLMDALRALNPAHWERAPRELSAFSTPYSDAFCSGLLSITDHREGIDPNRLAPGSPVQSTLMDTILLALNRSTEVQAENIPAFNSRLRSFRLVNRACEFIGACLAAHKVPSMVDLCTQCETPERTLQYCFLRELGVTPMAYLRTVRLNRVRAALLSAEPPRRTITQIATDFGFVHLSRFAAHYKNMFGELPSETLARSQPRPIAILF